MKADKTLRHIGYVHSTQGLRGELFLILKAFDPSWAFKWKTLSLSSSSELSDSSPSFSIQRLRQHKKQGKQGVAVTLRDMDSINQVESFVGWTVWLPEELLQSQEGEAIYLNEIENFMVVDETLGDIGMIQGFASNGVQDLLEIDYEGKMVYVPLVKAFIVKIDKKNKKLFMRIPEGLLDL